MAFEQQLAQEWKSASAAATESEITNEFFNCNICFEYSHDPVVTLCGHLYCWACIYKWFHVQSASLASDEHAQCPVCKADISHTSVVPLYGWGQTPTDSDPIGKAPCLGNVGMIIPPRPPAFGTQDLANTSHSGQQMPYRNPYQYQHYNSNPYGSYEEDSSSALFNPGGTTQNSYFHLVVKMLCEMLNSRVFGNSERLYTNPNSHHLMESSNLGLRRQQMQADKSLSRISFFILCCFFLCLLMF